MKKSYAILLILMLIPFLGAFGQDGDKSLYLDNANYLVAGRFVDCGSPVFSPSTTDKMTICVWVKEQVLNTFDTHEGGTSRWANIVTYASHNSANNGIFWLQHSSDNAKYEFALKTSDGSRTYMYSSITPQINKWYFVTAVYDGAYTKLYVNGNLQTTTQARTGNLQPFNVNEYRMNIGRIPASYRFFTGNMDEMRIYWGRALSQDEIRRQMHSVATIDESNLVAYYKFNSSTGITAIDEKGNANGTYYSGLVDVHGTFNLSRGGTATGYDKIEYKINDGEKNFVRNSWANKILVTIGGQGLGYNTNQTINSNDSTLLVLNGWINNNDLYNPKLDDPIGVAGLTWFGIKDNNSASQWQASTAPVCTNYNYVTNTTPTTIGPAGGSITMTLPAEASSTNSIAFYQWGTVNGNPNTTDTFPSGVNKRSNILWGVQKWGTFTNNVSLVIDYSNVSGVTSNVKLLRRKRDSNLWINYAPVGISPNASSVVINTTNKTITLSLANADIDSAQYSLGEFDGPMPVTLQSFTSSANSNTVNLQWVTSSELNNLGFEIQRAEDKKNVEYRSIGFVNGSSTSNLPINYSFNDRNLQPGKFKYRLKQIDYNGNFEFYELSGNVEITVPRSYSLEQNYPNPFNPSTTIRYVLAENCFVSLKVFDLLGKEIATLVNESQKAGYYEKNFSFSNNSGISSGIYLYRIEAGNYSKIMKMMLIK